MDKANESKLNDEVLAVIAAAIASIDTRPGYNLVVKSIRRVPATSPVWSTAGRMERISRKLNS
jgi:hypothetical protein